MFDNTRLSFRYRNPRSNKREKWLKKSLYIYRGWINEIASYATKVKFDDNSMIEA